MDLELRKVMLSECRCATFLPAGQRDARVSEEDLGKALTVNENLLTLGYTLKPADVARLAVSPSLDTFYEDIRGLMGDVKAAPMYPDFPAQVMEMDAAKFRFHQMLHYFTTYGVEEILGEEISKGWLPYAAMPREEADTVLLEAKVLELLEEDRAAAVLTARILQRRERMTLPERELVRLALAEIAPEKLERFEIPFKENLTDIFKDVMANCPKETAFRVLRALCRHTGDVLKCAHSVLKSCKYHLRTAQKRFLVKLLEDYPVADFKANLILSLKKAGMSLLVLQYLDYNLYSRSDDHREAVRALRDGELRSWEGQARFLLENKEEGALEFVAARPGMLLRMTAWMLRLGYPAEDIREKLVAAAPDLSAQTLVTTLTFFGNSELCDRKEAEQIFEIMGAVLQAKMAAADTPLRDKKVYPDLKEIDCVRSVIRCNDKSEEGGYIRSGIAYKLPEDVKRLRFFVYWNDKNRVDVDLHASACSVIGEKIRVGWNSSYMDGGIVSSGDITHSDAAEYIDVDMTCLLREVAFNINLFSGKDSFGEIETCYVGIMAVDQMGKDIRLYSPANCFFTHELRGSSRTMQYGYLDVVNRCLVFDGRKSEGGYYDYTATSKNRLNLQVYLEWLLKAQNAVLTEDPDEADVVLKMGKAEDEKDISLADNNYFL